MGRRYLAWNILKPHAGKSFPDLAAFMGVKVKARPVDIETSLRKWRAVMAAVETQTARRGGSRL